MLLGLQEIAGAMADPFGSDDTDFDTYKICKDAYDNAVAYLKCTHPSEVAVEKPSFNPLQVSSEVVLTAHTIEPVPTDRGQASDRHYAPLRA